MATATAVRKPNLGKPNLGQQRAEVSGMQTFSWVGTDKRNVKLRGEELSKNENLVKAELRKRGITPSSVKVKKNSLFGGMVKKA